jgi:ribonuclease HI
MKTIDENFLNLGADENEEISENQLKLLDLDLDKKNTWKNEVIKKNISDARAELFILLSGISSKTNQNKIIQNYKKLQKFKKLPEIIPQKIENNNKDITIFCDGGCSPNPGNSGSGIAIYRDGIVNELWYGLYEKMGTNNTAELNALYYSFLFAQQEHKITGKIDIKCDSMYSINCITIWAKSWQKNGWKKKGGEIKNLAIIKKSFALYNEIKENITLTHIKAHAGLEGNELADRMTIYARKTKEKTLKKYHKNIDISEIIGGTI